MAEGRAWRAALAVLAAGVLMTMPGSTFGKTREPILAGSWYPADPNRLREEVTSFLSDGQPASREVMALIVPHAGYQFSGPTAGKGFAAVRGRSFDRVILLGPSHRFPLEGAALPEEDTWRTPLGDVPVDREAIALLDGKPGFRILPPAHAREHCLEIEIPFLQAALQPGFRIVPIVVGHLDESVAKEVAGGLNGITDERTLLVVSSDFTHFGPDYGYRPFRNDVPDKIRELDEGAIEEIRKLSPAGFHAYRTRTGATICGAEPIRVLLTLLSGRGGTFETLGYARSGEIMADFTNSVSYVAMAYAPPNEPGGGSTPSPPRMLNETEQSFLLKLARQTILAKLRGGWLPSSDPGDRFGADSPLHEVRGVFVTLNEHDRLRGCMGNILGSKPLAEGVREQALVSAFEDPRFPPVRLDEADAVEIEISVLTPLVQVSGPEKIEVGRHGVLLEKRGYRAVFLPQVATEQGWDRDTMLGRLCRKAGLGPEEWRSGTTFLVFEAQVFGED